MAPSSTTKKSPRTRTVGVLHNGTLDLGGKAQVSFIRTLRVSEDHVNFLPPGLGEFPLRSVANVNATDAMRDRGGVVLPIYQREAMWMSFDADEPIALQIATGLVCAVTGKPLQDTLNEDEQNYVVLPDQPWLDGFKTADGEVRQFVAARLGDGATVEEQLTNRPAVGGIQIRAFRLKPAARKKCKDAHRRRHKFDGEVLSMSYCLMETVSEMGIGAGGRIQQDIHEDDFHFSDWETTPMCQVWVHLVGAHEFTKLTGEAAPPTPITVKSYNKAGLPWFDFYDADKKDVPASPELAGVKTVGQVLVLDEPSEVPGVAGVINLKDQRKAIEVPAGNW
jgi:hypothetical protein